MTSWSVPKIKAVFGLYIIDVPVVSPVWWVGEGVVGMSHWEGAEKTLTRVAWPCGWGSLGRYWSGQNGAELGVWCWSACPPSGLQARRNRAQVKATHIAPHKYIATPGLSHAHLTTQLTGPQPGARANEKILYLFQLIDPWGLQL